LEAVQELALQAAMSDPIHPYNPHGW
jgi:hypothetical protein